jgi:hypothetical protein
LSHRELPVGFRAGTREVDDHRQSNDPETTVEHLNDRVD